MSAQKPGRLAPRGERGGQAEHGGNKHSEGPPSMGDAGLANEHLHTSALEQTLPAKLTSLCERNPEPNLIRFRGKKCDLFLSLILFCVEFFRFFFFFFRTWRLRGNFIPVTHIIKLLLYRRQNIDKIDLDSHQTMNAEVANLAAKAAGSAWFGPGPPTHGCHEPE